MTPPSTALIVGTGPGLSASLARALAARGHRLILAARDTSDLATLAEETSATLVNADATSPDDQARLFDAVDAQEGPLAVSVYNAAARPRGPITDLDPDDVLRTLTVCAHGAFLTAQNAARRMLAAGGGTMLFTGASAGVKGYSNSASFAMRKFALRGLCQSLARELHPQGVHIGHVVVDGGIAGTPQSGRVNERGGPDSMLDPDELAKAYLALIDQHRSVWSWETEVRPWVEAF